MKYLIWQNNTNENGKLLNVLFTNHSFAEIFEGNNPVHPVGEIIKMHHKKYKITKFAKVGDDSIEVCVENTVRRRQDGKK